jgi:hypothetical protein
MVDMGGFEINQCHFPLYFNLFFIKINQQRYYSRLGSDELKLAKQQYIWVPSALLERQGE